jgi:hypothetical protein
MTKEELWELWRTFKECEQEMHKKKGYWMQLELHTDGAGALTIPVHIHSAETLVMWNNPTEGVEKMRAWIQEQRTGRNG